MTTEPLTSYLDQVRTNKFGFSVEDAEKLELSSGLLDAIIAALGTGNDRDVALASVAIEGLIRTHGSQRLHQTALIEILWKTTSTQSPRAAASAMRALGALGLPEAHDNESTLCSALAADEPVVRQAALEACSEEFITRNPDRIAAFATDSHIAEVGMGQPHRFLIRDLALQKLSEAFDQDLRHDEAVEMIIPYGPVYYWRWDHAIKYLKTV